LNTGIKISLLAATKPQKKNTITRGINCPQFVLVDSILISYLNIF
jgi:hypothetical protein